MNVICLYLEEHLKYELPRACLVSSSQMSRQTCFQLLVWRLWQQWTLYCLISVWWAKPRLYHGSVPEKPMDQGSTDNQEDSWPRGVGRMRWARLVTHTLGLGQERIGNPRGRCDGLNGSGLDRMAHWPNGPGLSPQPVGFRSVTRRRSGRPAKENIPE